MKAKFDVVKGDITTAFDHGCNIIIHGCNCLGIMGAGVAKALADKWPQVHDADINGGLFGADGVVPYIPINSRERLGYHTTAIVDDSEWEPWICCAVINLYTQYGIRSPLNPVVIEWDALERGLCGLFMHISGESVAMPEIGCGLAGGDVEDFYAILDRVMTAYPDVKVTIFRL